MEFLFLASLDIEIDWHNTPKKNNEIKEQILLEKPESYIRTRKSLHICYLIHICVKSQGSNVYCHIINFPHVQVDYNKGEIK